MGLLNWLRSSRSGEHREYPEPKQELQDGITMLGVTGNFSGLAKFLKSKNPHIRKFAVIAVSIAAQTQHTGGDSFQFNSGFKPDQRAAKLLIPMLKDNAPNVIKAVEDALDSLRADPDAKRALEEFRKASH